MTPRHQAAKTRMDAAYAAFMANAKLPSGSPRKTSVADNNTPINREYSAAYDEWMQARAAAGHRFAINLGYTTKGWSSEGWRPHA